MFTILVAEDDEKLRRLICTVLDKNGYKALPAGDGEEALDILDREYVDLLVADIMMPRLDGYQLTSQLREAGYKLPILIVTAKDSFPDKKTGFQSGADDYMVKPVDVNELALRVGALLRRAQIVNSRKLSFGNTALDYDSLSVEDQGGCQDLPQKEFYLLFKLVSYPNKTFTRQQLMDEIWGMDSDSDERTVDVHINRLRERFRDNADFQLVTVRGLGYKAVRHE